MTNNSKDNELDGLRKILENVYELDKERQAYLDKYYPVDIPNDVCKHAFIQGIKFENSFKPEVHDFIPLMKFGEEELFLWTHTKNTDTALVSRVSKNVKDKNFWKNIGTVINLAYSYTRDFEHTLELEYKWCYYFDHNKSIFDQDLYDFRDMDRISLLNGNILKLTDLYDFSPLLELLLRDDKAFTAMSSFYSSLNTHYCCLICELEKLPFRKHPSHEPAIWEQANVISQYEIAIVQACRCVEALIGKPPNRENKGRFLVHKQKWIEQLGINPEEEFKKGDSKYIDFYYHLFELRNAAAHSYGTIPFDLERKQAIEAQCFASLLLDGYVYKNTLEIEIVTEKLSINHDIIKRVDEFMSTSITVQTED